MEQDVADSGGRGPQEAWLEAAYDTLLGSGVEAVKILPLARQLKLSRTSFYWCFKDRDELLERLIARWRQKNTGSIVKQSAAYAESVAEAMLNIVDCWLDQELFDPGFEFAVRSWALQSPKIMAEVHEADRLRLQALRRMFGRFGFDDSSSDVRARTTYLVQIGYISMRAAEDLAVRMKRIPQYVEIFTGRAPEQRELDRFYARHKYTPKDDRRPSAATARRWKQSA